MSRGLNSRFPRTVGTTTPTRATIEREKIRHRRPNDAAFDDDDRAAYDSDPEVNPIYDDQDHADQDTDWRDEPTSWDDSAADEWVFDEQPSNDGVVWEDDQAESPRYQGDGNDGLRDYGFAPEVELAARRDVRPRPPKPPSQRKPQRQAANARQQDHDRPAGRRLRPVDDVDDGIALSSPVRGPQRSIDDSPRRPPTRAARSTEPPPPLAQRPAAGGEAPLHKRRHSSPKRRLSQTPVPQDRLRPRRWRKSLVTVVIFGLLAGSGWLIFQRLGQDDIKPTIEKWVEALALPGSERTAEDTSLEPARSPEDALADLSRYDSGTPAPSSAPSNESRPLVKTQPVGQIDPATLVTDGPPIPKFKPRDNPSRSVALPAPRPTNRSAADVPVDSAQDSAAPSIFERFWSYLTTS